MRLVRVLVVNLAGNSALTATILLVLALAATSTSAASIQVISASARAGISAECNLFSPCPYLIDWVQDLTGPDYAVSNQWGSVNVSVTPHSISGTVVGHGTGLNGDDYDPFFQDFWVGAGFSIRFVVDESTRFTLPGANTLELTNPWAEHLAFFQDDSRLGPYFGNTLAPGHTYILSVAAGYTSNPYGQPIGQTIAPGNQVTVFDLDLVPIPEPSAALLVGLGLAAAARRQRWV